MNMTGIVIDKEYMNQKYVPKFFRRRKIRKQCNDVWVYISEIFEDIKRMKRNDRPRASSKGNLVFFLSKDEIIEYYGEAININKKFSTIRALLDKICDNTTQFEKLEDTVSAFELECNEFIQASMKWVYRRNQFVNMYMEG